VKENLPDSIQIAVKTGSGKGFEWDVYSRDIIFEKDYLYKVCALKKSYWILDTRFQILDIYCEAWV